MFTFFPGPYDLRQEVCVCVCQLPTNWAKKPSSETNITTWEGKPQFTFIYAFISLDKLKTDCPSGYLIFKKASKMNFTENVHHNNNHIQHIP